MVLYRMQKNLCCSKKKKVHALNRDVAQLVWLNRDDLWNGAKTSEWARSQLDAVIAAEAQLAAWDEMNLPELIQPDDFSETDLDDPDCQPLGGPTTETEEEIFCTPPARSVVVGSPPHTPKTTPRGNAKWHKQKM